jgi:CheY-like chemotaxis protein
VPAAPRTILVIDDEAGVRLFVDQVLRSAGYTTVVAASGPDALRAAANIATLDLIVTDVVMPEMSGCDVVRRLRQDRPGLKALFVTGYSDRLFEERLNWKDEAFVEKPCSMKSLLEAVSLLWGQETGAPTVNRTLERAGHETNSAG